MKAEFQNTVSILVKAFLEGTLAAGSCKACAVGNICAAAVGTTVIKTPSNGYAWAEGDELWSEVFYTGVGEQSQTPENYFGDIKKQIDATGYSWQDLARIEHAFERAVHWSRDDSAESDFTRLMAVVDVLADIHGIDLATATAAKELFVRV